MQVLEQAGACRSFAQAEIAGDLHLVVVGEDRKATYYTREGALTRAGDAAGFALQASFPLALHHNALAATILRIRDDLPASANSSHTPAVYYFAYTVVLADGHVLSFDARTGTLLRTLQLRSPADSEAGFGAATLSGCAEALCATIIDKELRVYSLYTGESLWTSRGTAIVLPILSVRFITPSSLGGCYKLLVTVKKGDSTGQAYIVTVRRPGARLLCDLETDYITAFQASGEHHYVRIVKPEDGLYQLQRYHLKTSTTVPESFHEISGFLPMAKMASSTDGTTFALPTASGGLGLITHDQFLPYQSEATNSIAAPLVSEPVSPAKAAFDLRAHPAWSQIASRRS